MWLVSKLGFQEGDLEHPFQLEQVQRRHRGLSSQSLPPESSPVFVSHLLPLVPVNEALRSLHTESLNLKTKRFKSSDTLPVRLHSFLHSLRCFATLHLKSGPESWASRLVHLSM